MFEIALQITSLAHNKILNRQMRIQQNKNSKGSENQRIDILCVGDSFTQGVGAWNKNYSYPMQLQRYLQEKSSYKWNVYNGGVAAITSLDLGSLLPRLLEKTNPEYVCVLVGFNDYIINNLTSEAPIPSKPPLVHINDKSEFIPWKLRLRTLWLFKMAFKYFQDIKITKKRLSVLQEDESRRQSSSIGSPENLQVLFDEGRALLLKNRPQEASEIFTKIISLDHERLDAYIWLAFALILLKRIDEASSKAYFVRGKILGKPSPLHISLAMVFINTREFSAAYREIGQHRRYYPDDPAIYEALGAISSMNYHYDIAVSYLKKAIKMAPSRPLSYRILSQVYILQDLRNKKLDDSLRCWIQAYLLDKDIPTAALYLSMISNICNLSFNKFKDILDKFSEELSIDQNAYGELYMIGKNIFIEKDTQGLLKKNLYAISSLCLKYGAKPIFITYPMRVETNQFIKDYCFERGEYLLDLEPIFKKLLEKNKFEQYFVPDSHLNNEGYRILAERLGKFLMAIVSSDK